MLFNPAVKKGHSSKFRKLCTGPLVIEEVAANLLNYKIRDEGSHRLQYVHRNRLKLIPERKETFPIEFVEDIEAGDEQVVLQQGEGLGEVERRVEDVLDVRREEQVPANVGIPVQDLALPNLLQVPFANLDQQEPVAGDVALRRSARERHPTDRLVDIYPQQLLPKAKKTKNK